MGLFDIAADLIALPFSVAADVVELPRKVLDRETDILENTADTLKETTKDIRKGC